MDYSTTTGKLSRWSAVNWVHKYPNMRSNDAKALTCTTAPVVHLLRDKNHASFVELPLLPLR
ncbi:MAG: hypothetical protein ACM335_10395 [Deltaproteobacteria bacterium]